MIKSHPSSDLLRAFVGGELPPALALCVSAHVDMCRLCQQQVKAIELELAAEIEQQPEPTADVELSADLSAMMAAILDSDPAPVETASLAREHSKPKHIRWQQSKFLLPRALQRQMCDQPELVAGDNWRQLGKLWRGRLAEHDAWRTSFYYIEQGGEIPEHTHKGREITLVLSGSFVDGDEVYQEGDFIYRDGDHTHKPGASSTEDCLCFTAVEAPLHFTSGATRLLNPLGKLLY
ncbi:cupin domain-containing protein [Neiella sp. HB171785]|uniref:Cupin domain-containing protein n=1 Tax=Neiella litorisoli TaxID=2771431 RepID=A0A8J6UHZ8_9GAMM|nr:ChrR family anti-sigma-E factor [Neiella litorisoli]MBD1387903.1 cupin domain-containing protein [Neiella litorisoli]